ncbi:MULTISPECIES: hypothetical protein [unclassified Streptomyces]|uniref:hypothetical protein n=1 Tax=unclassified Streptomyces TaxID=2593676 RepID=UPI00081DCC68|nr:MULTISPECIES: hypothetical protein [unclassified Streptomyces]MYR28640.1 hypothetical protein [Streptomyces sp. SID4945]SCF39928.1 hypothetical protein GA0115257_11549 [Streptomyces sp. LcepLS]
MSAPTPEPLTPDVALTRLREYGERTSTWSTATYNDGTERALADIARTLGAEVTRLRAALSAAADDVNELTGEIADWSAKNAALRAELRQRPSRAEVHAEVARAAEDLASNYHPHTAKSVRSVVQRVLGAAPNSASAACPSPEPLVVSRFDVAMEPAPEEDPVLTIGCIAEDGRPVALQLDPEARRKVHEWTRSGVAPLCAPRKVRVISTESGDWRVRWRVRDNRKARTFTTEEEAREFAAELTDRAARLRAERNGGAA